MINNSRTVRRYPLLFRNTVLGRTIRFGCILIIFLCLTLLCGCFSHTGSFSDDDSVDNIYEQSFAVENGDTPNDELIASLVDYLQELYVFHDMPSSSLAIKINQIKNGYQPLLVDFDPTDFYYICGYYDGIIEIGPLKYKNVAEYTWVRYESKDEIKEIHGDKNFVVAFQINKALLVKDILSEKSIVPNVEHFQMYDPIFDKGVNINDSVVFEKTFIYLNPSSQSNVYLASSAYNHDLVSIPCIKSANIYYVSQYIYSINSSGEKNEANLPVLFDQYYESLMSVIQPTKSDTTNSWGTTYYYGWITIDDFVNHILRQ